MASWPYCTLPVTEPELRILIRCLTTTSPWTVPWISAWSVLTVPKQRPPWMHEERLRRHVAFDVSVDLHLAAIANFALEDHVLADNEYALICHHRLAPSWPLGRARSGAG
jgi:hypothetical protein